MINIKRYCKNVDITNVDFIEECIFEYLKNKWNRLDVQTFLSDFSGCSAEEIRYFVDTKQKYELYPVVKDIAIHMSDSIKNRTINLRPIRYRKITDGMNHKERIIGTQHPLHQMYDYVVVEGLRSMFNAKIGVFQCASLPGKGQSYGKKHIDCWVKEKETIYFVKGDIKKCFPSINTSILMTLLKRDVKNETLLWLSHELISMFDDGISIGSYFSQYLCNYYLSYAYHYASEKLFKIRKTKHKGNVRIRLINHVLFYMDDFLLTGSNKKDLRKAMKMLIKYICDFLALTVKPNWKICKLSDTEPIDMMGFMFRETRVTIRTKIFIKTRKYFLKAKKVLRKNGFISILLARRCISAFGWYKNTDSWNVRKALEIDKIAAVCKKVISFHEKIKRSDLIEKVT